MLGTALTLLLAGASQAQAAADAALYAGGLHISTGALVDPVGRTWVADHNAGFCRVTDPSVGGPGHIEHPERPGQTGPRTCLGGLLPDAAPGPDAAGLPAFFDPTPEFAGNGDELALIPDGSAPSSEVVRARWNKSTRKFEFMDTITMAGDRGRPLAVSVGPDDNAYVAFQRENSIQRIVDPAGDQPTAEIIGRTRDGRAAGAIAAGRDSAGKLAVYVAETAGLGVLRPVDGEVRTTEASYDLSGPDAAVNISTLAYDLGKNSLYAGTADGLVQADAGKDRVIEVNTETGAINRERATNLSMVGGVSVRPDGHVMVVDDPALLDPAEPMGTGRMFHVGLPVGQVTRGPLNDADVEAKDRRATKDATPAFDVAGDGSLECVLRGPGREDADWAPCPEAGRFEVGATLADGAYSLAVRSTHGGVEGLPQAHRFSVDTVAPEQPKVTSPLGGATVSASPWFTFDAEAGAQISCRFDDEAASDCQPGRTKPFSGEGDHTLRITATDRAGNTSAESEVVSFTVDPTREPERPAGFLPVNPKYRSSAMFSEGLHISTGAIVDPNGRIWVADHNAGFCRVTTPGPDGPGTIEHPSLPGDTATHMCLGGLLPEAAQGPDAAGQPTFVDPTPDRPGNGDEVVLIPDGASPSSQVVRVSWNPDSGLFEYLDSVTMVSGDKGVRPTATALGPDGNVYVVFQRSGTVQRIVSPAGTTTEDSPFAQIVGNTSDGRGAAAVAVGQDAGHRPVVYVAEAVGLRVLTPNAQTQPDTRPAPFEMPVAAAAEAPAISALLYDLDRDHLWVGTADGLTQAGAGEDVVHRVRVDRTTGLGEIDHAYAKGYTMVGGLGLRSDGVLFVLDDAALVDPAEPMGMGRMYLVGLPAAHIVGGSSHINTRTPAFTIQGDATMSCKLRGANTIVIEDCTDGSFEPSALAEGRYILTVQSTDEDGSGLIEALRFTVDATAPSKPRIVNPTDDSTVGATPWFEFDAEDGAEITCRWDAATTFTPCDAGRTRSFSENGTHTLAIKAVDRAGNTSQASAPVTFTARGVISAVTIASGPTGATQSTSAKFAFKADAEDVEFGCRISGTAFARCPGGVKEYTNLAEGRYTFEVHGIDSVGNVSPTVRRTFTVDRTAPVTAATVPTVGGFAGPNVTVTLSASEQVGWQCTIDGQEIADCGGSVTLNGLADGTHEFVAIGTDLAGNVATTVVKRFAVKAPAGAPAVATPPAPSVTVVDRATGQPLTIAIAEIDRRVRLADLTGPGIQVTVRAATGTQLIRFRIFRANRGGRAAAAAAKRGPAVMTVYRAAKAGRNEVTLTRKELRRLGVGKYTLEVTAGKSRSKLGRPTSRTLTVTR